MNNRERLPRFESLHLFIAIRRNKENKDGQELCFREVIRNEEHALNTLIARVNNNPGVWRIYKTVNARDPTKAKELLMMKLIKNPENDSVIDRTWKSCLLQPATRAEHKLMFDIDGAVTENTVKDIFEKSSIQIEELIKTPNGWNVVTNMCDVRTVNKIFKEYISIDCKIDNFSHLRDGVKFIRRFIVE